MDSLAIAWPMVLPSMSNARLHWAPKAKTVKAQRELTELALRAHYVGTRLDHVGHGMRMLVTLTRCAARTLDDDNLRGAFKAVRDAIAAYFGVNDNDRRIMWQYAQEPARESSVRVEFRVEARPDNGPVAADPAPGRAKSRRMTSDPAESPKASLARLAKSAVVRNREPDDEGAA